MGASGVEEKEEGGEKKIWLIFTLERGERKGGQGKSCSKRRQWWGKGFCFFKLLIKKIYFVFCNFATKNFLGAILAIFS